MNRVEVVCAKCCKTGALWGIRFEEFQPRAWTATWAFPIRADVAAREGYDRSSLSGQFLLGEDYPGCVGCLNRTFVLCGSCRRLGCAAEGARRFQCPWCRNAGEISGSIERLESFGDR
jgi:LSD1 subclass zinc finger protein